MKVELKTLEGKAILDEQWGSISVDGQGGPVAGAVATVDSAGAISQRITVTRLVTLRVFALALQKKKDQRELYLLVESPTFSAVAQIDPKLGAEARKFAAAVNTASKSNRPSLQIPHYVGWPMDAVMQDLVRLKLPMAELLDERGKHPTFVNYARLRVVAQSGPPHALVLHVQKVR